MIFVALSMAKRRRHAGEADGDGYRTQRGRSTSKGRRRSASGARDHSKPPVSNKASGYKWECWGTFAGRRCGKQCTGLQNCTRCGRSAPDKAWTFKGNREPPHRRTRSPSRGRKAGLASDAAKIAKLRKEMAQRDKDYREREAKRDRELRELQAAVETGEKPAVPDSAEAEAKGGLRKEIEALRAGIAGLEALVCTMPDLADKLAARKQELAGLVARQLEGQPTGSRLRGIETSIHRKDRQRDAVADEMAELETERIRIGAILEEKRGRYTELIQGIKELQVQRAELLDKQAQEARAPLTAAVPAAGPATAAPTRPTFQEAWAVFREVHDSCSYTDDERATVSSIAARVQQQHHQQLAAAAEAAPLPTTPRTAAAAADAGLLPAPAVGEGSAADVPPSAFDEVPATPPASIPAAQPNPPTQEMVGDRAAAGRDEFSQDVAMLPATPVGSVLDREPLTADQAMEEKRRRKKI